MVDANKRRIAWPRACALLLATLAACSGQDVVENIVVRVEVAPALDTVFVGDVATPFRARAFNVRNEEIPGAGILWKSDQPFIVQVDSLTGSLRGLQVGVAAITARAGVVADTAEIFVLSPLSVFLPLDTVLLAPGDTFTIPAQVFVAPGRTVPPVTFSGGAATVATVDPATGLVTAKAAGTVPFTAHADTAQAGGGIQVREVADTVFGLAYIGLTGAVSRRTRLGSRAFNHPTEDGRTMFQIAARSADRAEELDHLMIDSLVAPGTRVVGTLPPSGIAPGKDPVCRPDTSFVFYRRVPGGNIVALSVSGGTLTITTDRPIPGGRAISGRFSVTLQRIDLAGPQGRITALGTFAVPLLTLSACPQSISASSQSLGPQTPPAARLETLLERWPSLRPP